MLINQRSHVSSSHFATRYYALYTQTHTSITVSDFGGREWWMESLSHRLAFDVYRELWPQEAVYSAVCYSALLMNLSSRPLVIQSISRAQRGFTVSSSNHRVRASELGFSVSFSSHPDSSVSLDNKSLPLAKSKCLPWQDSFLTLLG